MEIRYNPHALLMARHLGTELNACPCYWPRKKGKIERPFNYIEEQFIKGNHFASMEDLNRRGKDFVESWCNETHTTTKRIPNIHYLQNGIGCCHCQTVVIDWRNWKAGSSVLTVISALAEISIAFLISLQPKPCISGSSMGSESSFMTEKRTMSWNWKHHVTSMKSWQIRSTIKM